MRLASEQLDDLAKKKSDLEKYQLEIEERQILSESIKDQSAFADANLRLLVKGWSKATNGMKKGVEPGHSAGSGSSTFAVDHRASK